MANAAWQSPGFGHIDPSTERQELRVEIDRLMKSVEKLVADKDLAPEDRISRVEALKEKIWTKKTRIAAIKAARRDTRQDPPLPKLEESEVKPKQPNKPLPKQEWKNPTKNVGQRSSDRLPSRPAMPSRNI